MPIYHLDPVNGNDATTATPLGWWSVSVTYVSGTKPTADMVMTGNTSNATATTTIAPATWASGARTMYFYGKTGTFQNETVTFSNGAVGTITADLTYCAWKTTGLGATAARINPGDTIRIAKSPSPVSIGNGKWIANTTTNGTVLNALNVNSLSNASGLIRLTYSNSYTLATGDTVLVLGILGAAEANGTWVVNAIDANTVDLIGSSYANARTSGGTIQKINGKAVVLSDSTLVKNVCDCEFIWTGANDGTPSLVNAATAGNKEGQSAAKITFDSATQTNKLQAYKATGLLDLSDYQNLTFWFYTSAAISNATTLYLALCSDTVGATPVDIFPLPALASTATNIAYNIPKQGGGNLSNSIQSIALYSGATAPANSSNIILDNIMACKTNGLNLTSLISMNSAEKGGDAAWRTIQSISKTGTLIVVDQQVNARSAGGSKGYYVAADTTTATYIRETIKVTPGTSYACEIQDSGSQDNYISFEGGYDITTNAQNGETFFDGQVNSGYAVYAQYKTWLSFNYINGVRFNTALYFNGVIALIVNNARAISSYANPAISLNQCYGAYLGNIGIYGNGGSGIKVDYSGNFYLNNLFTEDMSGGGLSTTGTIFGRVNKMQAYLNLNAIINTTSTYDVNELIAKFNSTNFINNISQGVLRISKATSSAAAAEFNNGNDWANNRVMIDRYNGDFPITVLESARVIRQDSTMTHGSGKEWKITTETNPYRTILHPVKLKIATVAVAANSLVTVTAWVKKLHATWIAAKLVFPAQLGAVESTHTKANDTNEEQLTVTFTPTESGVAEIELWVWYVASHSSVIVDNIEITQA